MVLWWLEYADVDVGRPSGVPRWCGDCAAYLLACEAENIETATPTAANVIARAADELATMIHRDTTHARELLADVFKSWRNNLIVEVAPAC